MVLVLKNITKKQRKKNTKTNLAVNSDGVARVLQQKVVHGAAEHIEPLEGGRLPGRDGKVLDLRDVRGEYTSMSR